MPSPPDSGPRPGTRRFHRAGRAKDARWSVFPRSDQEIDLARVEALELRRIREQQLEADCGCNLGRALQDSRHQDGRDVVRHHDRELTIAGRRIERGPTLDGRLDLREDVADRLGEALGERCAGHAAADLHQQLVLKVLTQPGQCAAHRRLAQMQSLARARDVLIGEQCVQRHQQVQVEAIESHALRPFPRVAE